MNWHRICRFCLLGLSRSALFRSFVIAITGASIVLLFGSCYDLLLASSSNMDITHIKRYFLSRDEQTRSQQTCPGLKIVAPGENIQVGELEVHVMSAIHRQDYPLPGAFNVLLVGWAYCDSFEQSFVCCLGNRKSLDEMVQVPAKPLFMDNRLKRIPMRYALYSCTVDGSFARESSSGLEGSRFRYVAFSETSCGANMTAGREIASAKEGGKKFGMCTKIAYGYLEPERLVEWFEFAKLIGVDVVQVFYHIVSERAMDVFRYYESTGFVILAPVNPAVMKGHPPRGFLRPRWEEQAWMDGTVICNDCVHRLSQYDFVAIMDFDELLLPSAPHNTLLEVAQAAAGKYPEAAAFFIETYIALLNWPASNNKSSIFFLRYLDHSVSDKLDNFGMGKSSPKLIYRPTRVIAVYTHDLTPAMNFTKEYLPKESHKFLHYRECKSKWNGCVMDRVRDNGILRFESKWLQAVSQLPLKEIGCHSDYTNRIKRQARRLKD